MLTPLAWRAGSALHEVIDPPPTIGTTDSEVEAASEVEVEALSVRVSFLWWWSWLLLFILTQYVTNYAINFDRDSDIRGTFIYAYDVVENKREF